jgi:hypothetical protein
VIGVPDKGERGGCKGAAAAGYLSRKEKQRRMARRAQCWRVHSDSTQEVSLIEGKKYCVSQRRPVGKRAKVYKSRIPRQALGHPSSTECLQTWHGQAPGLFHEMRDDLPGLDT